MTLPKSNLETRPREFIKLRERHEIKRISKLTPAEARMEYNEHKKNASRFETAPIEHIYFAVHQQDARYRRSLGEEI